MRRLQLFLIAIARIEKRTGTLFSLGYESLELLAQNGGGTNVIRLKSLADTWSQGVMYDCVRLELDETAPPKNL